MSDNLFSKLFTYRPRPNRKPLEDFVTECIGYFLRNDKALLERYLEFLFKRSIKIDDYELQTQQPIAEGRIDVAITWQREGKSYSLFIEHKVWSSPWEYKDDEGIKNDQITTYCKYQERQNKECNFVVLISNYPISGYSKEEKPTPSYLGNYIWSDISRLLKEHIKESKHENFIISLEKEFIEFMRRQNMAGFEDFTKDELASIANFESYEKKRNFLTGKICQCFKENFFSTYNLKKCDFWGEKGTNIFGVIYHNAKENKPSDIVEGSANLWILFGLYFNNDDWFPMSLHPEESIPDVCCGVIKWFDSPKDMKDFIKKLKLEPWLKEENDHFELISVSTISEKGDSINYLAILRRESLHNFLQKGNHEDLILSYLKEGYSLITNKEKNLSKILQVFKESRE